jgi:hypothetical protein
MCMWSLLSVHTSDQAQVAGACRKDQRMACVVRMLCPACTMQTDICAHWCGKLRSKINRHHAPVVRNVQYTHACMHACMHATHVVSLSAPRQLVIRWCHKKQRFPACASHVMLDDSKQGCNGLLLIVSHHHVVLCYILECHIIMSEPGILEAWLPWLFGSNPSGDKTKLICLVGTPQMTDKAYV